MDAKDHWERIYRMKAANSVSWYQADPRVSLELIQSVIVGRGSIIDVGGGASMLVDRLLDAGHENVAVLDISEAALDICKRRLGNRAARVQWIVADVIATSSLGQFDIWHDRAVFHFLRSSEDRRKYVELAARTVSPGGHLILATFSLDGPARCSGLDVCRYDATLAAAELGSAFQLVKELGETHLTPEGKPQRFFYGVFRRL